MTNVQNILEQLIVRRPQLEPCKHEIESAYLLLEACYCQGGKLLVCGNGGSAADSDHIVGELMKSFLLHRPLPKEFRSKLAEIGGKEGKNCAEHLQGALPAISLVQHNALQSAFANDVEADLTFAQEVIGYGKKGDILLALSTSGNSKNIIYALYAAKAVGLSVIGMTGKSGGRLARLCDVAVCVPETETFLVQELHLPVYHTLCAMLEERFWGESSDRFNCISETETKQ